jgi:hypothetical protein
LRSRLLAVALVTAGFVAGCTTSEAGTATPGTNAESTSTNESQPSTPSSVEIPPPPRDLSLDGIDPCTMLTEAQQDELKINDVNPNVGDQSIYQGMKGCLFDADAAEPFITYELVAVTDIDVSFWINEERNADGKLISIGDYPAAEFHIKGGADVDCAVAVGVAKNQHLHVEIVPYGVELTGEQLCEGSRQLAEMALQTLQTMR